MTNKKADFPGPLSHRDIPGARPGDIPGAKPGDIPGAKPQDIPPPYKRKVEKPRTLPSNKNLQESVEMKLDYDSGKLNGLSNRELKLLAGINNIGLARELAEQMLLRKR